MKARRMWLRRGWPSRAAAVVLLLGLATAAALLPVARAAVSVATPDVVRARFIANSNSAFDQRVKEAVRDAVMSAFGPSLAAAGSGAKVAHEVQQELPAIEAVAQATARQQGAAYAVQTSYEDALFPAERFGSITLPPGRYPALVVRLGSAAGHNWWGVLFPPLSLVGFGHGTSVGWRIPSADVDLAQLNPAQLAAFRQAVSSDDTTAEADGGAPRGDSATASAGAGAGPGSASTSEAVPAFHLTDNAIPVVDESDAQPPRVQVRWLVGDWFRHEATRFALSWNGLRDTLATSLR